MNLTVLIVQRIGGAVGGYAAGNFSKQVNLGTIVSIVVGALGGGVGGQIFFDARVEWHRANRICLGLRRRQGVRATLFIGFLKSKISA